MKSLDRYRLEYEYNEGSADIIAMVKKLQARRTREKRKAGK